MDRSTTWEWALGRPLTRRRALRMAGAAGAGVAALMLARRAAGQPGAPQLTALADDVFEFSAGGYNTIFIVTSDGVIATDPISQFNPATADAYKEAVASVTDQPVKYVVYSHDHADHITGGIVFADTAEFISQELAAPKIAERNNERTPVPTITFAEHMTLRSGETEVELYYTGRNHSDNSLVLLYGARSLLFAVDFISVNRVPFRNFPDAYPDEWVDSLWWIESHFDFDVLVPGHGELGTHQTVRENREYMLDLMAAIRDAREEGNADNSEEMVAYVRERLAPLYGSWGMFDQWLPENIEGLTRLGFSR